MKLSKGTIIAGISILAVAGGAIGYYLKTTDTGSVKSWTDSNWLYRKSVVISNSGSTLTNEDVLITVDTAALVTAGKLQNDCDDLRFVDSDESTYLNYWIEDGCNTSTTNIWIRIPSLPSGGKSIYMYYGNSSAINGALTWGGNIFMYADTSCPTGWTAASTLNGKFLYGSSTYGTTGGSDTDSPGDAICTSSSISTTSIAGSTSSGTLGTTITHTHTNLKTSLNSASLLPSYKNVVVCYNNHFLISSGLISLFTSAPSANWTRFSALDNIFARANSTYGTTGGSNTNTHTMATGYVTDSSSNTSATITTPFNATGGTVTYSGGYTIHTFTSSGTFTVTQGGSVQILVIGGGGGGGYNSTYTTAWGGGGAGGYIYNSSYSFAAGSYTVTIGAGGATNNNGENSSVSTLTAIGGGKGATRLVAASTGGSGGGGGNSANATGAAGTTGQGNSGGNTGGGGGGAGSAGTNGDPAGGNGGSGLSNSISGTSICYAGGGGGKFDTMGAATCGGGAGGTTGTANTGGGGGARYAGGSGIVIIRYLTPPTASGSIATSNHTHTTTSTSVSSDSHVPPYMTMLFEKANSDQYVNENNIVMTSTLPPLGWNRYTQLDNKFVMGSATSGTTGGSATHTHTVTISTGAPSATITAYGTGTYFANSTHTHSCTTTVTASNLPSYYSIIYMQRKISVETIIGEEVTQNTIPNAPTNLYTEGSTNPTGIGDTTPEFSAVFSDPDTSDTGNYYEIEVNTEESFTGTIMWDSTKTSFSSVIANGTRSSDIAYDGATLQLGTTYYWRIKFWDNNTVNSESAWSDTAYFATNSAPTAPTSLYCQNMSNPIKVTSSTPTFSAKFNDPDSTDTGIYYDIMVNTSSDFSGTSMWNSGQLSLTSIANGARSQNITYAGTTLNEGETYYWKIMFWDNNNHESQWSDTASFIMKGIPDTPTSLKTNGLTNATMLTSVPPFFTAYYSDPNGDSASAYQIQVNTNALFTGTSWWDSEKVNTTIADKTTSSSYEYAGTTLSNSSTILYWRIRFWDTDDTVSEWSEVAQFTDVYKATYFQGLGLNGLQIN